MMRSLLACQLFSRRWTTSLRSKKVYGILASVLEASFGWDNSGGIFTSLESFSAGYRKTYFYNGINVDFVGSKLTYGANGNGTYFSGSSFDGNINYVGSIYRHNVQNGNNSINIGMGPLTIKGSYNSGFLQKISNRWNKFTNSVHQYFSDKIGWPRQ